MIGVVIEKIINNNIVSAVDEIGKEIVVMGRGLGFGMKPGMKIDKSKIEKTFRIDDENLFEKFKLLLSNIPLEYTRITEDIISHANDYLSVKLNQGIYITLVDHINFTLQRYKEGIVVKNALLFEIKSFYREEYSVGKYAVDLIKKRFCITLPDDEAGFIALHFVNAEYGRDIQSVSQFPELMKKTIEIIKKEMKIDLDENSLHYERFLLHLKFLLQRVCRKEILSDMDEELAKMIHTKCPKEYDCSKKIAKCIKEETGMSITEIEIVYLALHIRRATKETD